MNLGALLNFVPLIIGVVLAWHLIFKKNLPSENLGKIITYFVGILIVFFAVSWLVTTFLAGWATDLLEAGTTSTEWQQFVQSSEGVVDEVFDPNAQTTNTVTNPTPVTTVQESAPVVTNPGTNLQQGDSGPVRYTVKSGDTLTSIARQYGVTVNEIVALNSLASANQILVGQVILIPTTE